ncbi:FAD linked oxidase N-terminal [Penicillium concentricum]|uniref:FAD linked oxidase N-terminal n=1 Tax=Penicillium concentricum TaxID=293559 RepID=A0A9W9SB47_9EURO|nr:FAD linked oxidase N-terminal [Penicillium concentricum]KAJ5375412.1 FAD linked oxidase N-terminal [Penicillium concentricum]
MLRTTVWLISLLIAANAAETTHLSTTAPANCQQACAQLSTLFGSAVHYPGSDDFIIWDAKQQEARPSCRIEPRSAADVAKVLNVLVDHWCYFSVKGGGHSRNAGDSNSVGGVTVDLNMLRQVEVLDDGNRARVGGGATSIQVYHALESRNLSFVGGRVGSVGMGGFTLGGGTSPFSNKYGWGLDNVFEYEFSGSPRQWYDYHRLGDAQSGSIFRSPRGGNNFAIVTAFTIRTFTQGPVFTGQTSYSENYTEQVLDKAYDLFTDKDLTNDVEMGYDLYYSYRSGSEDFTLMGTQRYGKAIQDPPVFRKIDQIPTLSRTTTIGSMSSVSNGSIPMGTTRNLFATLTVSPSRSLLSRALQIFRQEVEAIKSVPGISTNLICYPMQRNAIAAMKNRGGNALGIDLERDEPLFIILLSTAWSDASDDVAVNWMTKNAVRRIALAAHKLDVANRYIYINYASADQASRVFSGYGEENLQRLKDIQKAVDPRGIFTSKGLWKGFMKLF